MRPYALPLAFSLFPLLSVAAPDDASPLQEEIKSTRELRALMQSDPHRPIYHFVAPEGNAEPFDPNGAIYWNSKYHLGYIYQKRPLNKTSGPPDIPAILNSGHVWGHVVSTDLVHWTQYPDMLDIEKDDKEIGIYSGGSFVSREGVPHVIYLGVGTWSDRIASAQDTDLKVWKKFPQPALTPEDPKYPKDKYAAGDPEVWYDKKADAYYLIAGGFKPALFKSKDMRDWSYLGDVVDPRNTMRDPGEDLSCPDFFSLGNGKSMLLFISHLWGAQYYIGTFGNDRFTAERHARMNWPGGSFFAPRQLQDDKGRNIIWGWVFEHKPAHLPDYGWSGIMSLPRVVTLGNDGKVHIDPAEELKTIRTMEVRDQDLELAPGSERTLKAQGKSIELKLEIFGAEKSLVGVKVLASPDLREETIIGFDPQKKELVVNFSRSSEHGPVTIPASVFPPDAGVAGYPKEVSEQRAPLELRKGEPLKLDIFVDRSVIEVFANGTQCVTQVVYPELAASTQVKVFAGKEKVIVRNIQSWSMAETNAY